MSNIATNPSAAPLRDAWDRFVAALERGCDRMARVQSRRASIEALEAKSDAELERLGIPRDQIAYHVFKDLFYT
jgi:uncharacterized protein YjiS (DUF1127 family)